MTDEPEQPDLFAWAESRPTAEVIDFIPHVIRQIWRQRGQPRIDRGGKLVPMPSCQPAERRSA